MNRNSKRNKTIKVKCFYKEEKTEVNPYKIIRNSVYIFLKSEMTKNVYKKFKTLLFIIYSKIYE